MLRSASLEKINAPELVSNAAKSSFVRNPSENTKLKRRRRTQCSHIVERYQITVKPKLIKSSSLSDLTNISDSSFAFFNHKSKILNDISCKSFYESSGDTIEKYCGEYLLQTPYMSWNFKGKKLKRKIDMSPETHTSKYVPEYIQHYDVDHTTSSYIEDTSVCSGDDNSKEKLTSFPFKSTPSGNLKVQSNQVVFQSATVGVLLADPTLAKVKVKFKGNTGEVDNNGDLDLNPGSDSDTHFRYERREAVHHSVDERNAHSCDKNAKSKNTCPVKVKEQSLLNLGYNNAEPIDWTRVQLPKKQDLFQEFYRRVHNYINTDTVIHIGREEFHCHHMVLQIYSSFFELNTRRVIELPIENVKPEAFHTIYDWMIYSGQESSKVLRRENVLDLFCAAQYLVIKDLEEQCWSFMVNESLFTEDTAFVLFREARAKGVTVVMDLMVPRVKRFFLPLVASKDFLELELEELMTFLRSNYICVTSEIEVLMAGVRWLHGDWSSRSCFAIDVMRCVRFGLISPWQLVDIKRNPDNAEILEIVNEPEVQQMVDDGLAYVIIKYWYGNNSNNYYHWIDVLGLTEPAERNWIGEEKNHVTYQDFLNYLEQFMVPKDQMYQQMAMMQSPRRNDDNLPGSMRGMDNDKMRRPKLEFPLPATITGLTGDKEKLPTMSEFFENRRKVKENSKSPVLEGTLPAHSTAHERRKSPELDQKQKPTEEPRKLSSSANNQQSNRKNVQEIRTCTIHHRNVPKPHVESPEKESAEGLNTMTTETSSETLETSATDNEQVAGEKRHSVAASFLAAATASLAASKKVNQSPPSVQGLPNTSRSEQTQQTSQPSQNKLPSPQISLFNQSKELFAKANMNKLSMSILGPSNKTYITEKSLFNWERETVLVFGGIDPHTPYGLADNKGDNIYRFDPVSNTWDCVDSLPEPRHHHSVAFLRGRVYLVGGADPRDDDLRGKSVVVSTVWSYEPVTRAWYSEAGLVVPRKNFGLVVHRKALYAIGGQDKKGRVLRSVERFDPKTSSWCEVRPMGAPRTAVAAVKYREYIWVAGGMTGEKRKPVCRLVECYNSETNEWTQIHSLRFPRCFATLFAMNDKLYIIGGAGKISDKDKTPSSVSAIDVWDWRERQWKLETELSIPRHGHALAYLGTQIIIIGGVTTIYMRALNNVESFCCERGAWIRGVAPLPAPLSGHSAVTLPPASLM
ncbi:uncharacterized protein [Epargyreus clarus]|uniref:uncharacterized protein n=1 Tax=Epargyreus clarus TaxID=520877 RepID=UPI003C2FA68C